MPDHEFSASELRASDCYRLLTDIVTPRPIAWVSTQSASGARNLAPYSYFQAVASSPPTVVLGCGWLRDGTMKDTLRNILETGEFTIAHVSSPVAVDMNESSAMEPPGHSEWDRVDVTPAPARRVKPPRVAQSRAHLECRLVHAIPVGTGPTGSPASTLVVGEVVHFHLREGLAQRREDGRLAPAHPGDLDSVGRLGGNGYVRTTDRFELARPASTKKT